MDIRSFFRHVDSMTAEEARQFMQMRRPDDYNLIDVRQPKEYESGHIPGAVLIPVGELQGRLEELDPLKPTITYCGSGMRSRAAAGILANNGFREVFNLSGGIREWEGASAQGAPESGTAFFPPASAPAVLIAVAWTLEEGSRRFYSLVAGTLHDEEFKRTFLDLAAAEDHHRASLVRLYRDLVGREPAADFPAGIIEAEAQGDIMEGGMRISEAMEWLQDKDAETALDLSISLETNAYDLYIRMGRSIENEQSKRVFRVLAEEEKTHLERLGDLLERKV